MTRRSQWLATFSPARRGDLMLAYNDAIYFGRETLAKEARRKGRDWMQGKGKL